MEPTPGIKHNLQPREENSYPVSEGELDSLTSFSFTASLVAGLGTVFAGVAISTALQAKSPWTVSDCIGVVGGLAMSVGLFVWSYREVTQGKNLLRRIKRQPRRSRRATADYESRSRHFRKYPKRI